MTRLIISAIIAILLLFLYGNAVYEAILPTIACASKSPVILGDGQKTIITLVGGLVSALVISLLAVTPPGGSPAQTVIASAQLVNPTSPVLQVSDLTKTITSVITNLYLITWLLIGICAVYFGLVKECKTAAPELAAVAKSWLGIAITSVYAFFGLKAP